MRADAYDAYDAYDNDSYDAYEAYGDKWRPPPRRPATYGTNAAASAGTTRGDFVTKADLALALTPVSKDVNDVRSQIAGLGKRIETALVKVDKDTTNARRDMGAAKRSVQSAQMMALLPMLLQNNAPPQIKEAVQSGVTVQFIDDNSKIISPSDLKDLGNDAVIAKLKVMRPVLVDKDGVPVTNIVNDVGYSTDVQVSNASNNNLMLVLMMMMMMGGFGGSSNEGKEFGGSDNNMMMMMLLIVMMMRPQTITPPSTVKN